MFKRGATISRNVRVRRELGSLRNDDVGCGVLGCDAEWTCADKVLTMEATRSYKTKRCHNLKKRSIVNTEDSSFNPVPQSYEFS
jgi:hypothetical protein